MFSAYFLFWYECFMFGCVIRIRINSITLCYWDFLKYLRYFSYVNICRSSFMKKLMKRVLIMRARWQLKIIANKERSRIYEIICLMHLCIIVRRRRAKWKCKERYRSRLLPCIHIVDIWKCAYYKKVERHLIF